MITGDFNVRSLKWWSLDKQNAEGQEINSLTSACGYNQIINQPTNITKESSSCIDLAFGTSPNLISNTDVDLSLFHKCHHSLRYSIIDFNVPLPPPYLREVWDYENPNSSYIQTSVSNTDYWKWDYWKILNLLLSNKKLLLYHSFSPKAAILISILHHNVSCYKI